MPENNYPEHIQSPILITKSNLNSGDFYPDLEFHNYCNSNNNQHLITLTNTGYTVNVELKCSDERNRPRVCGGPLGSNFYNFDHYHFHWSEDNAKGSEHVFDNKQFGMEIHLVHYNCKYKNMQTALQYSDGLAVVAIFCTIDDSEERKQNIIFKEVEEIRKAGSKMDVTNDQCFGCFFDILNISSYITYKGSLTTVPYNPVVTWILMEDPLKMSTENLNRLRTIENNKNERISNNLRPIQNFVSRENGFGECESSTANIVYVDRK